MKYLVIIIVSVCFLFGSCVDKGGPKSQDSSIQDQLSNSTISPPDLIGKTIKYQYGKSIYHVTIVSDSELHWEAMTGEEKGTKEDETYKIASIDSNKLFITWGEANGIGVSQVLDFEKGIVYNHLLRGRDIDIGTGTIMIIDTNQ